MTNPIITTSLATMGTSPLGQNRMAKGQTPGTWFEAMADAWGQTLDGQAATKDPDPNSPVFAKFMKMADQFRGDFGVRANADCWLSSASSTALALLMAIPMPSDITNGRYFSRSHQPSPRSRCVAV